MESIPTPPNISGAPLHVAIIMDGNGRWAAARASSARQVIGAAPKQ